MGLGTVIDVTNEAVVVSDCSISGDCRYCGETLCAGCSHMPTFMEEGQMVCPACQYEHKVKLPEMTRLFRNVDDYFDYVEEKEEA